MKEYATYIQDEGKWKECEFLSGEEMAQRATELLRENERLNNIINELEEYLIKKQNSFNVCNAKDILYKLKELKENCKRID